MHSALPGDKSKFDQAFLGSASSSVSLKQHLRLANFSFDDCFKDDLDFLFSQN